MYARQYLQREIQKEACRIIHKAIFHCLHQGKSGGSKAKIDNPKRTTELIRITCELNFY
jgi:hypothetical protein